MYFPKPSLNENDLAIIERGDTAAHSIEAGQYVSWKGKTGKTKAAILQGATLDDTLFDYDEDGILNSPIMPDYQKAVSVTIQNNTFTAPSDGILYFACMRSSGATNWQAVFFIDGIRVAQTLGYGAYTGDTVTLFMKKGNVLTISNTYVSYDFVVFVPFG